MNRRDFTKTTLSGILSGTLGPNVILDQNYPLPDTTLLLTGIIIDSEVLIAWDYGNYIEKQDIIFNGTIKNRELCINTNGIEGNILIRIRKADSESIYKPFQLDANIEKGKNNIIYIDQQIDEFIKNKKT